MEPQGDCIWIVNPNDYWFEVGGEWPSNPRPPIWDKWEQKWHYRRPPKPFWRHCYLISLSEFGPVVFINADNEQDALDFAIDFAEEMGWDGLLLSCEDIKELVQDAIRDGKDEGAYLEEHIQGGNHGRYLSSHNIHIEQVRQS